MNNYKFLKKLGDYLFRSELKGRKILDVFLPTP